jgi:hypothetical protein
MAADRPKLRNLSEIFRFLRRNETPIYVVMPTPFSLLGLDQWVGSMEFVNYFDIFEGQHPRCYIPPTAQDTPAIGHAVASSPYRAGINR